MPLQKLRIFVGSPKDVERERASLASVAADLQDLAEYVGVMLDVVDWRKVTPDLGRPEQVILDQIAPSSWDLFIGILWHRFGMRPQGPGSPGPQYEAGTEEEFQVALSLWKKHGRPRVWFYRATREVAIDAVDPKQLARVQRFFRQFAADGGHPGLFQTFDTPAAFERLVRGDLTRLLLDYSRRVAGRSISKKEADEIQERGLDAQPSEPKITKPARAKAKPPQERGRGKPAFVSAMDLKRLYNFPAGLGGGGQTIGIIELAGGYQQPDLDTYFRSVGLDPPRISLVSGDGAGNSPGDPNTDALVTFDIELCGSLAPAAHLVLYFGANINRGFLHALRAAVNDDVNRPSVLCINWGQPESAWPEKTLRALDLEIEAAAEKGITVCCAAGDRQAVHFPASSPYVLACGGTRLNISNGNMENEVVWNDGKYGGSTAGGVSAFFPMPSWQAGAAGGGTAGRWTPDVAAHASTEPGVKLYLKGMWVLIGGTFVATDVWGALIALLNQARGRNTGHLAPTLYKVLGPASVLRDVVEGSNGLYQAGPGWDACTGWGSPDGQRLLSALKVLDLAGYRA